MVRMKCKEIWTIFFTFVFFFDEGTKSQTYKTELQIVSWNMARLLRLIIHQLAMESKLNTFIHLKRQMAQKKEWEENRHAAKVHFLRSFIFLPDP